MDSKELIDEEVVEEIIPVSFTSESGFFKKALSYGGAAIVGALTLEFVVKPVWKWLKKRRADKKESEFSEEYYDEEVRD